MRRNKIDLSIIISVLLFAFISILTIYSASTYISKSVGNLALKQLMWYIVGFGLVMLIVKLKNKFIYQYTWLLYIICNVLLLVLLIFATPINNSKCWFTIPGIGSFQPSEFMKIILILTFGIMIDRFKTDYKNPTVKEEFIFLLKTLVVLLIPSVLTFLEPDTGVVIIYFVIYVCMMFLSGIRLRWFLIVGGILLGVITVVFGSYFLNKDLFISMFGTNLFYRLERVFSWGEGSGLQLENALAAIGSAGFFGYGFNNTPIYFPESGTDFIFAVFASNFGLLGSFLLISLILFFDMKLIGLSKQKIDATDKYVIIGCVGMLLFQQVQNIGMTVGLFPITGITLPFISYGGSSLLSYMVIIGIIINIMIDKQTRRRYM